MNATLDFATVDTLIGQTIPARILSLLTDGRARTTIEIADAAGVSRHSVNQYLGQLVNGELVRIDRQGRHRYFRLASQDVTRLLEPLLPKGGRPSARRQSTGPRSPAMRRARMCYDHLAGELGIGIVTSLIQSGGLVEGNASFELTANGEHQLAALGVDVATARQRKRSFARTCIDWSERQPHLAGALGAALADRLFELHWIEHEPAGRTVFVTPEGQRGLATTFGLNLPPDP